MEIELKASYPLEVFPVFPFFYIGGSRLLIFCTFLFFLADCFRPAACVTETNLRYKILLNSGEGSKVIQYFHQC